ncbi:MAG: MFS transporter [Lentihominibacter sp.]
MKDTTTLNETNESDMTNKTKQDRTGWIMTIYLLGLFLGALSTGSITPVRTIIQSSLNVDDQLGIWMITIYTLCYAAIIPVSGKLADRLGRKIVFIASIMLFGAGSAVCGLSAGAESFGLLLCGRVIQASGAGGIMPIATAEFGTSFPEEKRGMALGMVGGVYGIANVLGATVGSAVLDIFGVDKWQWIFLINIPICVLIIIGGLAFIPNHKSEKVYRIDKLGTLLITMIILSLLYGLKNIDFFDFLNSLTHRDVWLFLLIGAALIPVFVLVEKKAEDPIFHIEYMTNSKIMLTLGMGLMAGCSMMGMIFIPQFAENCMKIPSGSGGYFVIILGVMAGAVAPISGRLIDRFGAKPVLGTGFAVSITGALYLAFVTVKYINAVNVTVCLILIGLGLGLIMGTPLNYMMLRNTNDEDSNSALATLSLIRSVGTAIAPAIMVGFIAQAGVTMQDEIMKEMPELPEVPQMEQQVELRSILDQLSESEEFRKQTGDIDLEGMLEMDMKPDIDMTAKQSSLELPEELTEELRNADVTTITEASKDMARYMFDEFVPPVIDEIQGGMDEGILGISNGIDGINSGISELSSGISDIDRGRAKLKKGIDGISRGIKGMTAADAGQKQGLAELDKNIREMQALIDSGRVMPEQLPQLQAALEEMSSARDELKTKNDEILGKISASKASRNKMKNAYSSMGEARNKMAAALEEMKEQQGLMIRGRELLQSMRDDIPEVFAQVEEEYLQAIDDDSEKIEAAYQKTLNGGFRNMFICVAAFNLMGLILLLLYRDDRRKKEEE